jgi:TetR/AcrR family transcriptional repressor of nem operon
MKKASQEMRQHIIDVARSLMTYKGYTAVGLAEVLGAAEVPKGSFYHYFKSKDEFGQALLEEYFSEYLARIAGIFDGPGNGAERLERYFQYWADTQNDEVTHHKCLVVKLGAEVCDLSEDMRLVMVRGTSRIIQCIAECIDSGTADGSIPVHKQSLPLATSLYQLWLGASLQAKLTKSGAAFEPAMTAARQLVS